LRKIDLQRFGRLTQSRLFNFFLEYYFFSPGKGEHSQVGKDKRSRRIGQLQMHNNFVLLASILISSIVVKTHSCCHEFLDGTIESSIDNKICYPLENLSPQKIKSFFDLMVEIQIKDDVVEGRLQGAWG
jgi:hypothetical protein